MTLSERMAERAAAQDELLVRAVEAINRGNVLDAHALAERILADDTENLDARTLLATEEQPEAEVRRITVMFCDLVGSTSLSARLDPELYRGLLSRYQKLAVSIVEDRHGGFVVGSKGDGVLAMFGYPIVHGDDTERGVMAGLEIVAQVHALSDRIAQTIGEPLDVRAALHRGLLYVDPEQNDVYGLAANVAARLQDLAEPGQVVVSDEVRHLVADRFEMAAGAEQFVKGLEYPVQPFVVVGRLSSEPLTAIRAPVVGRSLELGRLHDLWSAARESTESTVLGATIVGEAGIGKSRLLAAVTDEVEVDGATVVSLAGSSDHQGVGFHPLRRLIEARCGIKAGSADRDQLSLLGEDLASLGFVVEDALPLVAPILALGPDVGYVAVDADGQKLTDDIAKSAAEYVLACLGDGPAMLVVDDHHHVDEATADLIMRILESGRPQTFVLAASRLGPIPSTEPVYIGPLARDACLALIDAIAPTRARARLDRSELVERSDGVPLFLEELVRGSAHEPVYVDRRPASYVARTVPDALYDPLMARLYASPATVAVAAVAATIGREVDLTLLSQCVELTAEEVAEATEVLLAGLILERIDRDTVRFRHELMREVANDLISPSRRREVHAQVADALIASADKDERSDWTIIATHLENADRPGDAAEAWRNAAEDARRRGLVAEARLRLGSAIDQVALLPPSPARNQREVELRLQRGFLASSAEGMSSPDATIDHERCLELTLDMPHAPSLVSTLVAMWGYFSSRADLIQTRQLSTAIRSLIFSEDWGAFWRPSNAAGFAILDWLEGDFVAAAPGLEKAVNALYALENFDTETVAAWYMPTHPTVAMHVHLALARFMVGDTVGADDEGRRAIAMCEGLPFPRGPWSAAYCRWYLAWMYMERADYERSLALVGEIAAIGERHGYDNWSLIAMTQQAASRAARDLGSPGGAAAAPAHAILSSLVGAWQAIDLRIFQTVYLTILGRLAAEAGDPQAARDHYEASLALADTTAMRFYDAETLRCRAHLANTSDEVVVQLTEALVLAREHGARPFELRIALDLLDIRGEAAMDELRAAVDGFRADASYRELDDARARLAGFGR